MARKISTPLSPVEAERAAARSRAAARARTAAHQAKTKAENAARRAKLPRRNPLFDLPEEKRAKIFSFLRDCPYDDAVRQMTRDLGVEAVTRLELDEFFQVEAEGHWQKRIERAAHEANALVRLVEENPAHFSSGILAALGQEVFRQIASGQAQPESMNKMATLFMRARSDERADQMGELKREKLRREMQGQVSLALETLAVEVDRNPGAREAFEALQEALRREEA